LNTKFREDIKNFGGGICKIVRTLCQAANGPNVLKNRSSFSFKDKAGQEKQLFFPDCLTLEGEGSAFL
jgi:hypothetical protein